MNQALKLVRPPLLLPVSSASGELDAAAVLAVSCRVTPQAALDAQIARYRQMTREQRVAVALRLHELACEMARLGIRRQHPDANPAEVERLLRERLALARTP